MYRSNLLARSLCVLLAVIASGCAWNSVSAQSNITSGAIQGAVTDANGAVVPGATVEAKNLGTNATNSFTTDADGRFVFSLVAGFGQRKQAGCNGGCGQHTLRGFKFRR